MTVIAVVSAKLPDQNPRVKTQGSDETQNKQ